MGLQYLRADENVLYGRTVTTTGGATDSTYTDEWLVDGRNRPVRASTGSAEWTVSGFSGEVGVIVPHSHNIDASRAITITGVSGVSGATGPAARTNGIPVNPWITCTPATITTLAIGVASNSVTLVIAELLAGKLRSLTYGLSIRNTEMGYLDIGSVKTRSRSGAIPDRTIGLVARYLRTSLFVSNTERKDIEAWYEGTMSNTLPSAILPFSGDDAWCVFWAAAPTFAPAADITGTGWTATLSFNESERKDWVP